VGDGPKRVSLQPHNAQRKPAAAAQQQAASSPSGIQARLELF